MADPRFFTAAGPFDLAAIAARVGGTLAAGHDGGRLFAGVAPLESAGPDQVSFLDNRRYLEAYGDSRAGACFVAARHAPAAPQGMVAIVCEQPYLAFALAARMFHPPARPRPGISAAAAVADGAVLGEGCRVEAGAVLEAGVEIGARCHIGPGAVLHRGVRLGGDCRIGAAAVLMCCLLGHRVAIGAGAVVGSQGFGFALGPEGAVRIPHTGRVLIGDDVEVGANTTIDRGTAGDTEIGAGTMIDNQVQIAHNVTIGRNCVLAGQVGLAGSARIGDGVMLGGKSGVANHVRLGSGARLGAFSGAAHDIEPGATHLGQPALPARDFWRRQAVVRRLSEKSRGA